MTRILFLLLLLPTLALAQPAKAPASAPAPAKALSKAPVKALVAAKALPKAPAPAKALLKVPASVPASAPASAPAVALPLTPQKAAAPPASQPAQASWKVWLQANWVWLLVAVFIPSILNGLRKKGVKKGIIGFLEALLDRLSVLTNKNSPNTLKALGTRSQPPKE